MTRGDCVNIVKFLVDPGTADGRSFEAGVCGIDFNQGVVGAANRGQCVKTLDGGLSSP